MAKPYRVHRWRWSGADPALAMELSEALGISPVMAQVLVARGYTDPAAARDFLDPQMDQLHDPLGLRDMDRAVAALQERIAAGGPVLVYGDYDVDGVVGTSLLVTVLQHLGVPVEYYIPNRFTEGYGLNREALERARARGLDFVLTVDTGISGLAEAEAARELGMTMVITDHHEPGPELPRAQAVVDPKRPDCPYPSKGLCGTGVAFKLAEALLGAGHPLLDDLLELVALATVADLVPLVGENRVLVKEGLARMAHTRRPGLAALKEVAELEPGGEVTAYHVGFVLGPRLNALGRMGDARTGVELLLTQDWDRARELARFLDQENRSRQEVERQILEEALAQLQEQPAAHKEYAAVLAGEGWHHGVVGIVASRVVEATHRPAVLLAIEGDEARGSARSIPGFNLYRALYECRDLLEKFGGHAMAAGMTLKPEKIPALRERLNRLVQEWMDPEDLAPEIPVDGLVPATQVTPGLVAELSRLQPHGLGNPTPRLVLAGADLVAGRRVGQDGSHLKLQVRCGSQVLDGIGFGLAGPGAPGEQLPRGPSPVALAFTPEINRWNGSERLQLVVKDLQFLGTSAGNGASPAAQVVRGYQALTPERLLAWDPLAGLEEDQTAHSASPWWPLVSLIGSSPAARQEVAAAGEEEAGEADGTLAPDPGPGEWPVAIAGLAQEGRLLVLVAAPWGIPPVVDALRPLLAPEGNEVRPWWPGEPGPGPGAPRRQVVVAAWGQSPAPGGFAAAVALHPPYHAGQVGVVAAGVGPRGGLYAGWSPEHWRLLERNLSWPYPDRPELVTVYKLLRGAGGSRSLREWSDLLAAQGDEPMGPWNYLRIWSAVQVLSELGLVTGVTADFVHLLPAAVGMHGKMNLSDSPRYRRGMAGRMALARMREALQGVPGVQATARTPA